jgi:hypothetical protein
MIAAGSGRTPLDERARERILAEARGKPLALLARVSTSRFAARFSASAGVTVSPDVRKRSSQALARHEQRTRHSVGLSRPVHSVTWVRARFAPEGVADSVTGRRTAVTEIRDAGVRVEVWSPCGRRD